MAETSIEEISQPLPEYPHIEGLSLEFVKDFMEGRVENPWIKIPSLPTEQRLALKKEKYAPVVVFGGLDDASLEELEEMAPFTGRTVVMEDAERDFEAKYGNYDQLRQNFFNYGGLITDEEGEKIAEILSEMEGTRPISWDEIKN